MESGSLSSLDNLTHLGFRDGVDMRPTLIRVLTDLYVQKLAHTLRGEAPLYRAGAAAPRFRGCGDTRSPSPTRLARHLSPPVRVIVRLASDRARDRGAGAFASGPAPKQEKKPAPPQVPLTTKAPPATQAPRTTQTPPVAHAVRAAPQAPPAAQTLPASRGPDPVNPPQVPAPVAPPLPPKRERPERPAAATRSTITADVASELNEQFFAASADERRLILLNLHIAVPMPAGRVGLEQGDHRHPAAGNRGACA